MNDLINTWSVQFDLFVICITDMHEIVDVVAAALRLEGKFPAGVGKCFDEVTGRFCVSLGAIIDLEWRGSVEDQ